MSLDDTLRKRAVELFELGYGYKAVASKLSLKRSTVREWAYTWRALGTDLFLHREKLPTSYSPEVKLAAVKDRLEGIPMAEVMKKYQICNRRRIKAWRTSYAEKGEKAFDMEDRHEA